MSGNTTIKGVFFIVVLALFLRVFDFSFPAFTTDEARTAYRAYVLSSQGKDELGRSLPLFFNSLTDYQLPVTSYIAAIGVFLFGKTDFGVRIPFIILGIFLTILTYKISQLFSERKNFWVLSSLVIAYSPTLIFLSKIPSDSIVLAFIITLLFYLLTRKKLNNTLIIVVIILSLAVSKFAWFVITPFVIFTLFFYQDEALRRTKISLSIFTLIATIILIVFYLQVPQSRRSLLENNFPIFSSSTITDGINKMRGQGEERGWSKYIEKILFNKADFLIIGFMHWLSSLQPGIYFGQFDKTGQLNFSQEGALEKILIIPFIGGSVYLIRRGKKRERLLFVYFVILTYPAIFIYPNLSPNLTLLTIPFMALVIAFGFVQFKRVALHWVLIIMVLEICLSLLYRAPEERNTNFLRPVWIQALTHEIYTQSINNKTAISDDITADIITFIEWYNPIDSSKTILDVPNPYRFRQSSVGNIRIIGSDNELYLCGDKKYDKIFISQRDKDRIKAFNLKIAKTYKNNLNQEIAYLMEESLCIK